jgi:hypothetical protein
MVAKIDGGRVTLYSRNGEAMLATQAVPSQARLQPSSG